MKTGLSLILTLVMIAALTEVGAIAQSTETQIELDDDSPVSRAARVTVIEGSVSFQRSGIPDWAEAHENLPLLSGDQLYTGESSNAEIQLGKFSFIRLGEKTSIAVVELSDEAAHFELTQGAIIVTPQNQAGTFSRFEVNTPEAALLLATEGLYRIDVNGGESTEVTVREGHADVTTLHGSFSVQDGQRLFVEGGGTGRLEIAWHQVQDDLSVWSASRDTTIDQITSAYVPDEYSDTEVQHSGFFGLGELAGHGTWTSIPSYGTCWIPRVSSGWAPYRIGQWIWVPAVGWTWLSREPWGWAPYYYGRWSFIPGFGWAWFPGYQYAGHSYPRSYYTWRPALVRFFNCPSPGGRYVGWYPLQRRERWRRTERDDWRNDRRGPGYPSGGVARDRGRRNANPPQQQPGITLVPVSGFTNPGGKTYSGGRPEITRWDTVEPGLPDILVEQKRNAVSLVDERRGRNTRAQAPPREAQERPVVTRTPVSGSNPVPGNRTRRMVTPRPPIESWRGGDVTNRRAPGNEGSTGNAGNTGNRRDVSGQPPAQGDSTPRAGESDRRNAAGETQTRDERGTGREASPRARQPEPANPPVKTENRPIQRPEPPKERPAPESRQPANPRANNDNRPAQRPEPPKERPAPTRETRQPEQRSQPANPPQKNENRPARETKPQSPPPEQSRGQRVERPQPKQQQQPSRERPRGNN